MLTAIDELTGRAIAGRAQARRLAMNLTQAAVAARSGVSLGSYKRFERTGEISLSSLLRIARVLDAATEIHALFPPVEPRTLDDVLAKKPRRRRRARTAK